MTEPRKELTFLEHLEELRWTLVRSAAAVVACTVLAFIYKDFVFDTLILAPQRPDFITYRLFCQLSIKFGLDRSFCADNTGFTLMNTTMGGQFLVHIMVSFTAGIIIAFPYVLWEVWRFVKPGLGGGEKLAVRGVVFFATLLFLLGVAFGYYVLAPMSIQFLGTYKVSASVPNIVDLNSYIGTITSLTLWTGLVFELPMIVYFLARTGLVGPEFLRTYRRHAYVAILIIGAIITPPDVTSQLLVSLPLMALYEASIFLAARTRRGMERAERAKSIGGAMRGRAIHTTMRLIALLSGLVVLQAAIAQTTRISGTVTDANTGEPLPFVNISFIDSRVSANSDFDGHYALETYYATDSIKAGSVGYVPFTAKVKRDVAQTIDIKMRPSTAELKSVTVTYAGNPAFPILRRLIANKPVNNREKLGAYQYDAYNKVEFDINNITEGFEKKKLFKDFAFIFDHVDTTGGKRFLPIFMTETLSEVYYRQQPKVRRELIHGSKTSGVENESISMFMGDMYQNVNIYDNYLVIFDKNFISPIADGGKGFYHYHLLDSNWVGNNWCYKIAFTPKRVQELAFTGEMWVNDTSYAVQNIEATIAPGANLNFVQSFQVKQEYSEVKPEVWMLTHDQLVVDLNIIRDRGKPNKHAVQGFYGRRTASYRDFVINKPRPDEFYKGADEVVMDIDPLSQGAAYWDENRHENLTAQEVAIYHMVDTMKTIPRFRTYVDLVTTAVTGYYTKGKIDIGPYFTTYSFNPIEGNRFRIGGRTSSEFSTRTEFNAYTAYGTLDRRLKFGVGGKTFVSKTSRQIVELSYKQDVEQLGESVNAFRQDNILSSVFRRTPNTKLTLVEESRASYMREWFTGLDNTVMLRYRSLYPLGDLEYLKPGINGEPDGKINAIHTAEISLNTRFAYKEKYISGDFARVSLGTVYPTVELHLAMGLPKLAHSEYGYQKVVAHVYQRLQLGALGWTRINAEAGQAWGALPYPLLILHSGNETFYYDDLAFNTMNYFEFISDRYAQLFVEHHFEGLIFNRIPLLRRLKWREVVAGKAVVGSLDREKHEKEMLLVPGIYSLNDGPYVEVSAGVENILKMLSVEGVWRLRYNDHPGTRAFALRLKLFINF